MTFVFNNLHSHSINTIPNCKVNFHDFLNIYENILLFMCSDSALVQTQVLVLLGSVVSCLEKTQPLFSHLFLLRFLVFLSMCLGGLFSKIHFCFCFYIKRLLHQVHRELAEDSVVFSENLHIKWHPQSANYLIRSAVRCY